MDKRGATLFRKMKGRSRVVARLPFVFCASSTFFKTRGCLFVVSRLTNDDSVPSNRNCLTIRNASNSLKTNDGSALYPKLKRGGLQTPFRASERQS
jgi:hypothetical protein